MFTVNLDGATHTARELSENYASLYAHPLCVRKNACLSRTFGVARKLQRNHFYAPPSLFHKNYNSSHAFYVISHHEA